MESWGLKLRRNNTFPFLETFIFNYSKKGNKCEISIVFGTTLSSTLWYEHVNWSTNDRSMILVSIFAVHVAVSTRIDIIPFQVFADFTREWFPSATTVNQCSWHVPPNFTSSGRNRRIGRSIRREIHLFFDLCQHSMSILQGGWIIIVK